MRRTLSFRLAERNKWKLVCCQSFNHNDELDGYTQQQQCFSIRRGSISERQWMYGEQTRANRHTLSAGNCIFWSIWAPEPVIKLENWMEAIALWKKEKEKRERERVDNTNGTEASKYVSMQVLNGVLLWVRYIYSPTGTKAAAELLALCL